jgi:hypothetical protein
VISTGKVYAMLGNESLWQVAQQCHEALRGVGVPHAIVGGVAVCLHGYQRNTVDLDVLVRQDDADTVRVALLQAGYTWSDEAHEFRSPSGIAVQFLLARERAGDNSEVVLPDPGDARTAIELEGLPVVSLARLIELKLACGEGNARRTHRDFADVVELIAIHDLSSAFARHLHKSLRKTFRELVRRARG